ncbi:uncharacterized protein [Dermacentor andersoni]|uniref:uncharacterized protein isoform X1 n=1 Tax=Dermacentor andersoni TaxID=34620 RepID=UPI0024179B07|nr:uncharacterized protein LOC126537812 isoform X1 [Dermacentor andersoni]
MRASAFAVTLVAIAPIVVDAGIVGAIAKTVAKVPKPAAKIALGTVERVGDITNIGMDLAETYGKTKGLPGSSGSSGPPGEWGGSASRDCGQCSCKLVWEKKLPDSNSCRIEATLQCTCNYGTCKAKHSALCIAGLAS